MFSRVFTEYINTNIFSLFCQRHCIHARSIKGPFRKVLLVLLSWSNKKVKYNPHLYHSPEEMGCVALRVSWEAKSQRDGRLTENCARIHPMFGYPMSPAMPGCLWVVDHWWYSALCTLHVSVSNALAVALCLGLSELLGGKTPVRRITRRVEIPVKWI